MELNPVEVNDLLENVIIVWNNYVYDRGVKTHTCLPIKTIQLVEKQVLFSL